MNIFCKSILSISVMVLFITSCSKKIVENSLSSAVTKLVQHRESYKQGFLNDQRSPLKTEGDIANLDFFNYNKDFDCKCSFTKNENTEPFEIPTYSGTSKAFIKYGTAQCSFNKKPFSIAVYKNVKAFQNPIYQDHLFLPFKDKTNAVSTYGGGRYIDMNIHDISNDSINIDFNKCYNPWCAYSDGFNCPIPPKENHLSFEVLAGEKSYKGEVKKGK